MALEVYFRQDIANILKSLHSVQADMDGFVRSTIRDMQSKGEPVTADAIEARLDMYRRGFRSSLRGALSAFGINDYMELPELEQTRDGFVLVKMPDKVAG